MTCIRPWAPTGLCANGLKLDSTAMTARISVGSSSARSPTGQASWTRRLTGSGATGSGARATSATAACWPGSGPSGRRRWRGRSRRARSRSTVGERRRRCAGLVARLQPAQRVRLERVADVGAAGDEERRRPTTTRPTSASVLWLTSSRPWPTSRRKTRPEPASGRSPGCQRSREVEPASSFLSSSCRPLDPAALEASAARSGTAIIPPRRRQTSQRGPGMNVVDPGRPRPMPDRGEDRKRARF